MASGNPGETLPLKPIGWYRGPFGEKFGCPRQSGLAPTLGWLEFAPGCAHPDFVRGLEHYSHLWLIWGFDRNRAGPVHATVRPPRLGGNTRVGVFATRSPYRPNPLGLSVVQLQSIEVSHETTRLQLVGADLVDGTPVFDLKPYLPYADSLPEATAGFAQLKPTASLQVTFTPAAKARWEQLQATAPKAWEGLVEALALDPRPAYQDDPSRAYAFRWHDHEIRFVVEGFCLRVTDIEATA